MNENLLNLFDYENRARETLPTEVTERINGRMPRDVMDDRQRQLLNSIMLRPRVMSDVSVLDASVNVAGQSLALPVISGGSMAVDRSDGNAVSDLVKAASDAGTVQIASAAWGAGLDDLVSDEQHAVWLEMPIFADLERTEKQLARAKRSGYRAVVLDLDPIGGEIGDYWQHNTVAPSATSAAIEQTREKTDLPIIAKGIVRGDEARQAVEHGATGVLVTSAPWVSDLLPAGLAVPEIVDAVGGACDILLSGGIRRGIDVLKAMALGVTACVVDRPLICAQALAGPTGIDDVYDILRNELSFAMETCGVRSSAETTYDLIALSNFDPMGKAFS